MSLAALLAGGASVLGGKLTSSGQESANKQNIKLAREQMAFQERMSNSAYQRSAKDLEKAGLNRILALGSPATSPSGALATMQNEAQGLGEGVKAASSSAMALKTQQAQIANMQSQNGLINAQTAKAIAEKKATNARTLIALRSLKATDPVMKGLEFITEDVGTGIGQSAGYVQQLFKKGVGEYSKGIKYVSDKIKKGGDFVYRTSPYGISKKAYDEYMRKKRR